MLCDPVFAGLGASAAVFTALEVLSIYRVHFLAVSCGVIAAAWFLY